jgi:hypothetical protein
MIDQLYGGVPPDALNVCTYGTPTVPLKIGATVVMTNGGWLMVRLTVPVAEVLALSVTWTEKLNVPPAVGVPEMLPVDPSTVNPAGRPCPTDH